MLLILVDKGTTDQLNLVMLAVFVFVEVQTSEIDGLNVVVVEEKEAKRINNWNIWNSWVTLNNTYLSFIVKFVSINCSFNIVVSIFISFIFVSQLVGLNHELHNNNASYHVVSCRPCIGRDQNDRVVTTLPLIQYRMHLTSLGVE